MRRALPGVAACLLVGLSCEPALTRDAALLNRPCRNTEPHCLAGYECIEDRCVLSSSLGAGGQGSTIGGQSSAGTGNGNDPTSSGNSGGSGLAAGAGGDSAASAGAPAGDAGSTPLSGSGGAGGDGGDAPDAAVISPDPPDAGPAPDAGCTPVRIFLDRDGDGFGSDALVDQDFACVVPEGWVTIGGDCFDTLTTATASDQPDQVHPGQTDFFTFGYHPDPNVLSVVSFDYDCSGSEQPDPDNFPDEAAPDCSQLGVPCAATGFEPTERTGSGVHPLCGSEQVIICISGGATCVENRPPPGANVFACQ